MQEDKMTELGNVNAYTTDVIRQNDCVNQEMLLYTDVIRQNDYKNQEMLLHTDVIRQNDCVNQDMLSYTDVRGQNIRRLMTLNITLKNHFKAKLQITTINKLLNQGKNLFHDITMTLKKKVELTSI